MKEWIVASGKGGAGKTSLMAALAQFFGDRAVLADCDVDAADLALLTSPEPVRREDFVAGRKAVIDEAACMGCGRCARSCPFGAILPGEGDNAWRYRIDPLACEGCGVCGDVCGPRAIRFEDNHCGQWFVSRTRFDSTLFHARLNPGEDNSGKLVQMVKSQARSQVSSDGNDYLLVDGPPGIGCPAIASLSGADGLLLVVEAGQSGLHDAKRLHELAQRMRVPCVTLLNKAGLSPVQDAAAKDWLASAGIECLGEIAYDPVCIDALREGRTWLEIEQGAFAGNLADIFEKFERWMETS